MGGKLRHASRISYGADLAGRDPLGSKARRPTMHPRIRNPVAAARSLRSASKSARSTVTTVSGSSGADASDSAESPVSKREESVTGADSERGAQSRRFEDGAAQDRNIVAVARAGEDRLEGGS
jgi:hypothetical protein